MADTLFSTLSDDVVLNIFSKLEDDPRDWARLACVCTKFSSLIRNGCWKAKCCAAIPSVVADLADADATVSASSSSSSPPGGWSSLYKLAVCCPGILHAGVLLENSDFGLERELGPNEDYSRSDCPEPDSSSSAATATAAANPSSSSVNCGENSEPVDSCPWSLYDDLYFDTLYNKSESQEGVQLGDEDVAVERGYVKVGGDTHACKRRKIWRSMGSHLASGVWNLCREQGNKLLARRFRGDCLYLCDWPGCVHLEEKRNYMLFRGVFKNFKRSMVWRMIKDGNRRKIDLNCAFCSCKETWDLQSAFCLRQSSFGYHDDGEPVVRAYVCENGHVSGAWTDLPLYT